MCKGVLPKQSCANKRTEALRKMWRSSATAVSRAAPKQSFSVAEWRQSFFPQ